MTCFQPATTQMGAISFQAQLLLFINDRLGFFSKGTTSWNNAVFYLPLQSTMFPGCHVCHIIWKCARLYINTPQPCKMNTKLAPTNLTENRKTDRLLFFVQRTQVAQGNHAKRQEKRLLIEKMNLVLIIDKESWNAQKQGPMKLTWVVCYALEKQTFCWPSPDLEGAINPWSMHVNCSSPGPVHDNNDDNRPQFEH